MDDTRHCGMCGGFLYGELQPNDVWCQCHGALDGNRLASHKGDAMRRYREDLAKFYDMTKGSSFVRQPDPAYPEPKVVGPESSEPSKPWVLTDADRDFLRVQRIDPEAE